MAAEVEVEVERRRHALEWMGREAPGRRHEVEGGGDFGGTARPHGRCHAPGCPVASVAALVVYAAAP